MLMKIKNIYFLLLSGLIFTVQAQVSISPTSLFIDSSRRFESLLVMNSSDVAQEVSMSWSFGYPKANAEGNIDMIYDDAEEAALHSAAEWIRGFPKHFILEPGARQTVRVTVKAPRKIASGTYWSRLKTTSTPVSAAVGSVPAGGISTQINIEFNQITGVFYKHGDLTTGLNLSAVRNVVEDNGNLVRIFADYSKTGNSPFLGTMTAKIYDVTGQVVKEKDIFVSIYYDGLRRLDIDVRDLPMGSYDVEVSFRTKRADIPDTDIIPAATSTARGSFTKL